MKLYFKRLAVVAVGGGLFLASVAVADILVGQSRTSISNDVSYSEVTLTKPSDVNSGDLLLAGISVNGGSPAVITAPSGWTLVARTDNDTNISMASYQKIAGFSEPGAYTWAISPQARAVGGITRYTGIDPMEPIDVVATSSGRATSATAPSVTASHINERILTLFAVNVGKDNAIFATTSGMTKRYDIKNQPYGPTAASQDKLQTTIGSTGTFISSFNAGSRDWVAQTIALRPLAAGLLNGMVSYWKLDETSGNANDATGNGFTLTNNNSASYNAGLINNAVDFGSSNTDKSFSIADNLGVDGGPVSVSLWAYLYNQTPDTYVFANQLSASSKTGYEMYYFDLDGNGSYHLRWVRFKASGERDIVELPITLSTSTWYHLVLTYDGTTVKGYKDGVLIGSTASSGSGSDGVPNIFALGFNPVLMGAYTSGKIDEVGIWDRALDSAEVSALYSGGVGFQYPF